MLISFSCRPRGIERPVRSGPPVGLRAAGWLQRCAPEDSASLPPFRAALGGGGWGMDGWGRRAGVGGGVLAHLQAGGLPRAAALAHAARVPSPSPPV